MSKAGSATTRIDTALDRARASLEAGEIFAAERDAIESLQQLSADADFPRLGACAEILLGARRAKRDLALKSKKVNRISEYDDLDPLLSGEKPIKAGLYLIEPLLVAADGRDLREKADSDGVAILVVVREPETQLKQWPVVMVGPETVRTKIAKPARIDASWIQEAADALGAQALANIDDQANASAQAQHMSRLVGTVVDHVALHEALIDACARAESEDDA